MKRRSRALAASIAPVKRLGLLALVFAFALQAYFVQTHFHLQQLAPAKVQATLSDGTGSPVDPLDPATCKLCREIIHTGATITPAAPALLLLLNWIATAVPVVQLPDANLAPQTGWQSRAPPRR
jgi:hypothetical protein